MANKWMPTDIEKISAAYASLTIEKCFPNKLKITGDEIVNITNYPQINYFILREIFTKWEESTEKMKSPYFNFESDEVVAVFTHFRNVLSKHILVGKEDFYNLLETSTQKTLNLYLQPINFFVSDFRDLPNYTLTKRWITQNRIFFKDYKNLIEELDKRLDQVPEGFYGSRALDEIKNIISNHPEDYTETVKQIALEGGLSLKPENSATVTPENDNLSFFERLVANPPKPQILKNEPEVSPFERFVEKVKDPIQVESQKPIQEAPPASSTVDIEKPKSENNKPESQLEYKAIFADLNTPTLNDSLRPSEGNSLADQQQKGKITSIKGSMSLNQKFTFSNSLFGGDLQVFESAIEELDRCNSFTEASQMLEERYSQIQNWNKEDVDTEEFFLLVKRRFN